MRVHSKEELARYIIGDEHAEYFLTIDTDVKRDVKCVACDADIVAPHCCYTGNHYAYV
jgi:hypothetical protein